MSVTIISGGFWGDEGKGKVVAYLAYHDQVYIAARAGVGPNAGHTIEWQGEKVVMRQVPCGFVAPEARLLIGAGVLVDPRVTLAEIERLNIGSRTGIDPQCTVILPEHIQIDRNSSHLREQVGTTGTGCGPANEARVRRDTVLAKDVAELKPYLADVALETNQAIKAGKNVLIEGSQGFGLSLYHGTFPYVTSKDTTASAFCMDVGIGPTRVTDVMLVFKAYVSRVGGGPFGTELPLEEVERRGWAEFGAVTGRRRRIGEFDYQIARRSAMINGATQICITCLDRRFAEAFGARRLEDLPGEAREFIGKVEQETEVPVTLISTGPLYDHMIDLRGK
ncbi:MAG: adenylosuccinate synthetase [Chloroflexi bacterium]|nr:adenylosuccinate synthetase [Chloroflexota bacterium]